MTVFKLLMHIGAILKTGKDMKALVVDLTNHDEHFPSKADYLILLGDLGSLLAAGLVNLPPDQVQMLTAAIADVQKELA